MMNFSLPILFFLNLAMNLIMIALKASWSMRTPVPLVILAKPRTTSLVMMFSTEDQPQEGRDNTSSRDTIFKQNIYAQKLRLTKSIMQKTILNMWNVLNLALMLE